MNKLVFASDELPAELDDRERFSLWHDLYAVRYGECEMSAQPNLPFFARIELALFGEVGVTRLAVTVDRHTRTARQVATDARDDAFVGFNLGTSISQLSQRDHEIVTKAGQAMVFTSADPYETRHDGIVTVVGVSLPRRALLEMLDHAEDGLPLVLDTKDAAARLLARYLEFLLGPDEFADEAAVASHISQTLVDLVALTLGAAGDAAELAIMRGLRAAKLQAILAQIKARFADPSFSAREVALRLGLTPRYVQNLLGETEANFTERVLELRLQKARAMLADPRHDRLKVSDIALACGFNEASYFNRCFRRRFGASPTQYRESNGTQI